MVKLTKNRKESISKFDRDTLYSLEEASKIVKDFPKLKFDSSVDITNVAIVYGNLPSGLFSDFTPGATGGKFRIYGSFGELFDTENEIINQSGYENVFDGKLGFKVPGKITKPNISNIVENTIIFKADGVSSKTFELISSNDRPLNPINIAIAFVVLTAVYFFVRQSRKTK